jgi:hypothetical protein
MIEDPLGPEVEELEIGEKAAQDLVAHMKRIKSASTSFEILDGGTLWTVTVEAKTMGKVN